MVFFGGDPEDPKMVGYASGDRTSIPIEKGRPWMKPYSLGTYHVHPPPTDFPVADYTVEEIKKLKREGHIENPMEPSSGDMLHGFDMNHQNICIGGRQEEVLGGEALIMCWTPPDLDYIDPWDKAIKDKKNKLRDAILFTGHCYEELTRIQVEIDDTRFKGLRLIEEDGANVDKGLPRQNVNILIQMDDDLKELQRQWKETKDNCGIRKKEEAVAEKRLVRDLMDYWQSKDIPPCIYNWPDYPRMVSGPPANPEFEEFIKKSDKGHARKVLGRDPFTKT